MQAYEPALIPPPGPDRSAAPAASPVNPHPPDGKFVRQSYESYSPADHAAWGQLFDGMRGPWNRYADERFLDCVQGLRLPQDRVPSLEAVNALLSARSGFRTTGVSGRLTPFVYFDCLRNRVLPTAVAMHSSASHSYLPEHNIFHDALGHLPMLADRTYAKAVAAIGDCMHSAAEIAGLIRDPAERRSRLTSILRAIERAFWFTVEFGLLRYGDRCKAYGSGLLSSAGEIEYAIDSPIVQRCDFNLDWVIHQPFSTGGHQPLLFIVESFDQLLDLTRTLERWMWEGRLDRVATGNPEVTPADLDGFLEACGSL